MSCRSSELEALLAMFAKSDARQPGAAIEKAADAKHRQDRIENRLRRAAESLRVLFCHGAR